MPRVIRENGWYWDGGIAYPSVTAVCGILGGGEALQRWYGTLGIEEADRQRDRAASEGSRTHALIRWELTRGPVDVSGLPEDGKVRTAMEAWRRWALKHRLIPILTEQYVCWGREGLRFAGTMDYYGWVRSCGMHGCCERPEGQWWLEVLDWKTSKRLGKKEQLQTPGYRLAMTSCGYPVQGCRLLRIGGMEEGWPIPTRSLDLSLEQEELTEHFLEAVSLFLWLRKAPRAPEGSLRNRRGVPEVTNVGLEGFHEGYQECLERVVKGSGWWGTAVEAIVSGRAGSVQRARQREEVGG